MESFPKEEILDVCRRLGPSLQIPAGVDPVACMIALASNESSIGHDCGPRHESSYDTGGYVYRHSEEQRDLVDKYNSKAAASYGPWQMMFIDFQPGSQDEIYFGTADLTLYALEFVRFFNVYVIRTRHAQTLQEIGEVWNLGHIGSDPAYVNKLEQAYTLAVNNLGETNAQSVANN